ncbi:uncharacterized protein DS421_14g474920 [Arachis hypogaea]|nr:uncharacterized protein DS421_14g474920 [Arachis hypogaea]
MWKLLPCWGPLVLTHADFVVFRCRTRGFSLRHAGDFWISEDPLFSGLCFGLYILFRYFYLH